MTERQTSECRPSNSGYTRCLETIRTLYREMTLLETSPVSVKLCWLKQSFWKLGIYLTVIMLFMPYSPCQQGHTNDSTYHIRNQVLPGRLPPGQINLMPFIQYPYKQRYNNSGNQSAPAFQSACQSNPASEQGKDTSMNQFIPRWGYQIHSDGVLSQYKQAQHDSKRQQHAYGSQMARQRSFQKENEHRFSNYI